MKVILRKVGKRFGFDIQNQNGIIFSSNKHYFVIPHIQSSYRYAWEACRDAWKLARNHPYHVRVLNASVEDLEKPVRSDISAEDMIIDHYMKVYRSLREKAQGTPDDPEDREMVYQEIKKVTEELKEIAKKIESPKDKRSIMKILGFFNKMIDKHFRKEKRKDKDKGLKQKESIIPPPEPNISVPKIASCIEPKCNSPLVDEIVKEEIMDEYAQKICGAIQNKHEDIYYITDDSNTIKILGFDNKPILMVKLDDTMTVKAIIPVGKLSNIHPLYSPSFYQKYWKPIVEAIGHINLNNILLGVDSNTLPDVPPREQIYDIDGWDIKNNTNIPMNVSFKGEKLMWLIRPSNIKTAQSERPSKYTEEEYLNAIVKCIDKNLKSIYGRTGSVVQIIPIDDLIEVDVDFGRGLDIVRLTEQQIEIIPLETV